MDKADQAPKWAKRVFLFFFNRLLSVMGQWRIWKLIRPTYLVGVYVVILRKGQRGQTEVLLVDKKMGISSSIGINLPSGGLKPKLKTIKESATAELKEETGITQIINLRLCGVAPNPEFEWDIHIIYGGWMKQGSEQRPKPQDTFEIGDAFWVSLNQARILLKKHPHQWDMVRTVFHDQLK